MCVLEGWMRWLLGRVWSWLYDTDCLQPALISVGTERDQSLDGFDTISINYIHSFVTYLNDHNLYRLWGGLDGSQEHSHLPLKTSPTPWRRKSINTSGITRVVRLGQPAWVPTWGIRQKKKGNWHNHMILLMAWYGPYVWHLLRVPSCAVMPLVIPISQTWKLRYWLAQMNYWRIGEQVLTCQLTHSKLS